MSWTLRLALRNLARHGRRTVLTTVAVVAGIGVLILGKAFLSGLSENVVAAAIEGTVGHVQVRPGDYPTQPLQHPVDTLLELDGEARRFLDAHAEAWTGRTFFAPLVSSGRDALRVRAIGYDPVRDPEVFPRDRWQLDGDWPAVRGDAVLVSPGVARILGLGPGDPLVLQARTHAGAINALDVTVAGVVTTRNTALDTLTVLVPADLTGRLLGTGRPSHVSARLADRDDAEAFAHRLSGVLGTRAEVVTWVDETAELLRLQQVRRKALDFVVLILLALAGFGMANTILMAAYERLREVGTLQALGMTRGGVLRLFVVEGALMGLAGSLLGAAWGGGLAAWWSRHPLDFSEMFEDAFGGNFSMSALVYTSFDWGTVAGAVAFGLVVAILASIHPARAATRMVPADAVRAR